MSGPDSEPTETTGSLLREGVEALHAAGSETARLDAELLLSDRSGVGRAALLAHPEMIVAADAAAQYRAGLLRRSAGEPVAYIRGRKEFYGLTFTVDRRALIPRPETERLVELAEKEIRRRSRVSPPGYAPIRVVDVGTGSGAIAVALAVSLRNLAGPTTVQILGLDRSAEALDLARANAIALGVQDAVTFLPSDLLDWEVGPGNDRTLFDLVLANLPYVRTDAMAALPVATSFEPALALDGGPDGLTVIERVLRQLPDALGDRGVAMLEIGADQGELIVARCERVLPGWQCEVEADLAGLPRVARIWRT